MIIYILSSNDKKEFIRVHNYFMRNRIKHEIKGAYFFIKESSPKVEKILKKWQEKYDTAVYALKKINLKERNEKN